MIPELVISLVPVLVNFVSKLIPDSSHQEKHDWVVSLLQNVCSVANQKKWVPDWAQPAEAELIQLLSSAIESELNRLGM